MVWSHFNNFKGSDSSGDFDQGHMLIGAKTGIRADSSNSIQDYYSNTICFLCQEII